MAEAPPTFVIPKNRGALALDDLGCVDWDHLRHARGVGRVEREQWNPFTKKKMMVPFAGVDGLFRDLVSTDDELRELAVNDLLFDALTHQSDLFEVSAYAIPFLAALAADPDLPTRRHVIDTMASMVLCAAFDPQKPECRNILLAFHGSDSWMKEVALAGPAAVTEITQLLFTRTTTTGYAHETLVRDLDQVQEWLADAFGPDDFLG